MNNVVKNDPKNGEGRVGVMGKEVEGVSKKWSEKGFNLVPGSFHHQAITGGAQLPFDLVVMNSFHRCISG